MSELTSEASAREGVRRGLPYAALSGILQIAFALIGVGFWGFWARLQKSKKH